MNLLEKIVNNFEDIEFLKADGFDDAVIGIDGRTDRLIYSASKVIEILVKEGMKREDALDHFYYNIEGSYMGDKTPIWCFDFFE
jgi:hypothetical protein